MKQQKCNKLYLHFASSISSTYTHTEIVEQQSTVRLRNNTGCAGPLLSTTSYDGRVKDTVTSTK